MVIAGVGRQWQVARGISASGCLHRREDSVTSARRSMTTARRSGVTQSFLAASPRCRTVLTRIGRGTSRCGRDTYKIRGGESEAAPGRSRGRRRCVRNSLSSVRESATQGGGCHMQRRGVRWEQPEARRQWSRNSRTCVRIAGVLVGSRPSPFEPRVDFTSPGRECSIEGTA